MNQLAYSITRLEQKVCQFSLEPPSGGRPVSWRLYSGLSAHPGRPGSRGEPPSGATKDEVGAHGFVMAL